MLGGKVVKDTCQVTWKRIVYIHDRTAETCEARSPGGFLRGAFRYLLGDLRK